MGFVMHALFVVFLLLVQGGADPPHKTQVVIDSGGGLRPVQLQREDVHDEPEKGTDVEDPTASLSEPAGSSQLQGQIIRRHQGQPEEAQKQQPPPLLADGEGSYNDGGRNSNNEQRAAPLERASAPMEASQPPPPPPLLTTGLDEVERSPDAAPASLLASTFTMRHTLSTPSAGADSCERMYVWGYEETTECRDEESPFSPSKCHCEMQLRTYRARYCNSNLRLNDPESSDGSDKNASAEESGYPPDVPMRERQFGYGACDKCCVRKHTIAPGAQAGVLIFIGLIIGGFFMGAAMIRKMIQKNKEYDKMRLKLEAAEAAQAAAEAASAESAAAAEPQT